jgi:hypothetical protein
MGWDGWQDPREAAAAAEMAQRAEEERRIEDARAQTMADAVRHGFADLAAAIVTAAGPDAIAAWQVLQRQRGIGVGVPVGSAYSRGIDPDGFNEASAQVDSDIDDLIDKQ